MIRKRTSAFVALQLDLKRPERLLRMERASFTDPPSTKHQRIGVEGLRGGAVVLMAATLEGYLKDVFLEVIDDLEMRRSTGKKTSIEAKVFLNSDFEGVEAVVRDRQGDRVAKHAELKRVARSIAAGELVGDGFSRTEANPRPDVVSKMLKRIGIDDPFAALSSRAVVRGLPYSNVFLRTKLDEIMDKRNDVAHGGSALNLTRVQLQEYVLFIGSFCQLVDETIVDRYKAMCR